jgi:hypothetical protein
MPNCGHCGGQAEKKRARLGCAGKERPCLRADLEGYEESVEKWSILHREIVARWLKSGYGFGLSLDEVYG